MPMQAQTASRKVQCEADDFAWDADGVAFHASAALEGDAVVASVKVAAFDHYAFAGIDVDAVSTAMNGDITKRNVAAVDRVG